jgi:hypothetical protein
MVARTFVDALGAMRVWINSRTATLVGAGKPLEMGAHLKYVQGGQPTTYAFLEEQLSFRSPDAPENMDMIAALSAQVYGGTREAATVAAVGLAEEISSNLEGVGVTVTLPSGASVLIRYADDIQGPSWFPDGDLPRLLVNWTVRMSPA